MRSHDENVRLEYTNTSMVWTDMLLRMHSPNKNTRAIPSGNKLKLSQTKVRISAEQQFSGKDHSQGAKMLNPKCPPILSSAEESDASQPTKILLPPSATIQQQMEDGNVDLADVDSRLQALQDFLRMAKASAASIDE